MTKIRTLLNDQVTEYKHDCVPTVNVISAISVFAINGQAEAGDELQDSLCHEKRTGVVRLWAAIVSFTGDRYDRHVHRNASHHVEQAHQQKYSSSYYEPTEINLISLDTSFLAKIIRHRFTLDFIRTYVYEK